LRYAGNIRRTIELIRLNIGGPYSPQMQEFAQIIDGEARLLEEFLSDVRQQMSMLYQRLRGSYAMEPFDLAHLIRQILKSFRPRAIHQKIEMTSNLDALSESDLHAAQYSAWGESKSIRHAIENLLANALKFTPSGGTIRLSLRALGSELELTVTDSGPGIPDEELPHIFDLFYQGKGRETMQHSTGLGLSIVKEIVAIHHGNIDVESEMGKGTTFYVRLPASQSRTAEAA
jgi:signal transduction histidine kinase